jgi:hypothetical protein
MTTHEHTQDSDCAGHIVDGECQVCGVWHNNECPECHGHGFHTSECPDNDNNSHDGAVVCTCGPDCGSDSTACGDCPACACEPEPSHCVFDGEEV